jgi:hypothetical protein
MAEFHRKTRGIVVLHRCLLNSRRDIRLIGLGIQHFLRIQPCHISLINLQQKRRRVIQWEIGYQEPE